MAGNIATRPSALAPHSAAAERHTGWLFAAGTVAGPLWLLIVAVQALLRPGFDITRHAVSTLTLGDLGFIQIANFVLAGALTLGLAVGARRALRSGRARTWGPRLIAGYGIGLVGAGIFTADPMYGFPPGTPDVPGEISTHGGIHMLFSSIAFICLVAACLLFARRFGADDRRVASAASIGTGLGFLGAWIALMATAARIPVVNVAFVVAVVACWTWLTFVALDLRSRARSRGTAPEDGQRVESTRRPSEPHRRSIGTATDADGRQLCGSTPKGVGGR
jgi:hypothetical membrane protein